MRIHIALEKPGEDRPGSIRTYFTEIEAFLQAHGVTFTQGRYDDPALPDGTDLVWAPGMGNRRLPKALMRRDVPTVATVHGLQYITEWPMIRMQGLKTGIGHYLWRRKIRADWRAAGHQISAVISVSDILRTQIAEQLEVPMDKIVTIPHGVSERFLQADPATQSAPDAPILHVSQYSEVKNYDRMAEAYAQIRDRVGRPFHLVAAGHPRAAGPWPEGCQLSTSAVPHEQMPDLLRGAHVFLFPSLEESFGLPVLEAMACGVPVVTSRGTGAAEVAGDAAICVDPTDVDDIARGLLRAATDTELRSRLQRAGPARAGEFSWAASGARHLDLFERLLRSGL